MRAKFKLLVRHIKNKLWFKPLIASVLSVVLVVSINELDSLPFKAYLPTLYSLLPNISQNSVESLLNVIASSMLSIATFSVGAMVAAYASASSSATPRVFNLLIEDDASKNALSIFIGAFIFSVVALTAIKNEFYDKEGVLLLFLVTLIILVIIILTFVRWVDKVARLGRIGTAITKTEAVTLKAFSEVLQYPTMKALPISTNELPENAVAIFSNKIGYVQNIDVSELNDWCKKHSTIVRVACQHGDYISTTSAIVHVIKSEPQASLTEDDIVAINKAFDIDHYRDFDNDCRFGLVALSEIASRALSPAVNDPGTAIDIIHRYVRIFSQWKDHENMPYDKHDDAIKYQYVEVPMLTIDDLFEDAYYAIARDGGNNYEVMNALVGSFNLLEDLDIYSLSTACQKYRKIALGRVNELMSYELDRKKIKATAYRKL